MLYSALMHPTIYKICPRTLWREAEVIGRFDGAPVDLVPDSSATPESRLCYRFQQREFFAAIRERRPPSVTAADGIRTMEVIDACYRAAERRQATEGRAPERSVRRRAAAVAPVGRWRRTRPAA